MSPEDLALIDAVVEDFKSKLFAVGHLGRTNQKQRKALAAAYSTVLNLPARLREESPSPKFGEAPATQWGVLVHTLRKVDPLWHTRGSTGAQAVRASIARLVDPDARLPHLNSSMPSLREMAHEYMVIDRHCPETFEDLFEWLANRDLYKDPK